MTEDKRESEILRKQRLKDYRERLAAKLQRVDAKLRSDQRKLDTRQKVVIGGGVMAHSFYDYEFSLRLWKDLPLRDSDKEALGNASTSENRRKIILGGACIARAKVDKTFKRELVQALRKAVTNPRDKNAIAEFLESDSQEEPELALIEPKKSAA